MKGRPKRKFQSRGKVFSSQLTIWMSLSPLQLVRTVQKHSLGKRCTKRIQISFYLALRTSVTRKWYPQLLVSFVNRFQCAKCSKTGNPTVIHATKNVLRQIASTALYPTFKVFQGCTGFFAFRIFLLFIKV